MVNIVEDDDSGCEPNDHFKSTRSLQVDWKTLEGQNMYLREEKLSQ